jgi:hypothetical protein
MRNLDWNIVDSTYIVNDRWLSLRADRCRMPDGRTIAPYYIFEYPSWVNVVAMTDDGTVVLVKQVPSRTAKSPPRAAQWVCRGPGSVAARRGHTGTARGNRLYQRALHRNRHIVRQPGDSYQHNPLLPRDRCPPGRRAGLMTGSNWR